MIRFGPMSTSLCAGFVFGLLVAGLLTGTRHNRSANRFLAGVLVVFALTLVPYILGFAGFFDRFRWLTFVPVTYGLALGPLIYLHVVRLTTGLLPARWAWHFVPAIVQGGYYAVLFVQPLAVKEAWANRYDGPWIDPAETWIELLMLLGYLVAATRRYRSYQTWLDATWSNREEFRLPWIRHLLVVLLVVLPGWACFELASALLHFNYFQRFPLYLGLTALVTYVGLQGWRHADVRYPVPTDAPAELKEIAAISPGRDWADYGRRWQQQLAVNEYWRDPNLSLPQLARYLGTNTAYLSRALNEGLGLSFHEVVNQERVSAVMAALSDPHPPADLVALALAAGFNSKSSFNRQFKAATGLTPSDFRARRASGRANA